MKITRRTVKKETGIERGKEADLFQFQKEDEQFITAQAVDSGMRIRVAMVPYHYESSKTTHHNYYVELSREDLRQVFDALLAAVADKDDDLLE